VALLVSVLFLNSPLPGLDLVLVLEFCGLGLQFYGLGLEFYGLGFEFYGLGLEFCGLGLEFYGLGLEFCGLGFEFCGLGLQFYGLGLEFCGLGLQVYGLGLEFYGLGFEFCGLGLQVYGLGLEFCGRGLEFCGLGFEFYGLGLDSVVLFLSSMVLVLKFWFCLHSLLCIVCAVSGVMYICIHGAVNLLPVFAEVSAPYCILFSCGKQVAVIRNFSVPHFSDYNLLFPRKFEAAPGRAETLIW